LRCCTFLLLSTKNRERGTLRESPWLLRRLFAVSEAIPKCTFWYTFVVLCM
jgi:hypothetical protein